MKAQPADQRHFFLNNDTAAKKRQIQRERTPTHNKQDKEDVPTWPRRAIFWKALEGLRRLAIGRTCIKARLTFSSRFGPSGAGTSK